LNMFDSNDLHKFSYSKIDKKFLQKILLIDGLGRKTAAKVLFYLKKHEVKSDLFWVEFLTLLKKIHKNKTPINSINKSVLEQKYYSILKKFELDNIRVLCFWEKDYPKLLKHTDDFPLILYVKGNLTILNSRAIAVVGTRKVTPYGEAVTKKIVNELVTLDYAIVSGCMYGVDAVAHKETLDSDGKTIAVLGYGFDKITPVHMKGLQAQILQKEGCLITEYLPNTIATKGTFPQRNRIVAGMSLGVVVTEAALKSGTHITARCALEAGREVFAVPGSIFNPFTNGTRYLLNQGATLVSSGLDVVADFKKEATIPDSYVDNGTKIDLEVSFDILDLDKDARDIVREIVYLPKSTSDLAQETKLSIKELLTLLGMLELENIIENQAGVWHCMLLYSGQAK
jgi:DNA processing protein